MLIPHFISSNSAIMFKALLILILVASYSEAKVFKKCELAKTLLNTYKFPKDQIATWVCIAHHESRFNTKAINHKSKDYGIFQINARWWCSLDGKPKACNLPCSALLNDDIADDVTCIKRIYNEHKRLKGNGFKAWVTYKYCHDPEKYIDGCF